jgi:hypothetical protein
MRGVGSDQPGWVRLVNRLARFLACFRNRMFTPSVQAFPAPSHSTTAPGEWFSGRV